MARLKTGKRILDLERSLKKANEDIRVLSITDQLTGAASSAMAADGSETTLKDCRYTPSGESDVLAVVFKPFVT